MLFNVFYYLNEAVEMVVWAWMMVACDRRQVPRVDAGRRQPRR